MYTNARVFRGCVLGLKATRIHTCASGYFSAISGVLTFSSAESVQTRKVRAALAVFAYGNRFNVSRSLSSVSAYVRATVRGGSDLKL